MGVGRKFADDNDAGLDRGVGRIDDAERRLAARYQQERRAHVFGLRDIALHALPGAELLERRLAVANVDAVPAGKYGKAALEKLGAWNGVKDNVAQAENVRAALLLVARGEAPLGIVYSTDAAAEPTVKIIGAFPADSHPPIIYPAAEMKDSKSADAKAFLDYLKSSKARPAFEKQGFTVLD